MTSKLLPQPEGQAVLYCQDAFKTTDGKTTHGLVRFCLRYNVRAVIDSSAAGVDAGEALGGAKRGVPIVSSLHEAEEFLRPGEPRFFVVGLAVLGGRLGAQHRPPVIEALKHGFNIVCGLHDYLCDDPEFVSLAAQHSVRLIDVRKPRPKGELHAFSGKIEEVTSLKVAALGTDSAIGKRTTAWKLVQAFHAIGKSSELVGTGQTAWMQGARYSLCLDTLINDYLAGELEHWTWLAWKEQKPDTIVIEGQGSLLNPAYPGGYEILAACRPDLVIMQHAPRRKHYEDFPKYPVHPLKKQIAAMELISGKPVVAITLNHQDIAVHEMDTVKKEVEKECGLPCFDPFNEKDMQTLATLLLERHVAK